MAETRRIQICCFCFSVIEFGDSSVLVRTIDPVDGLIMSRGFGHEDCSEKRWNLIDDYRTVLEKNRQDMPGIDQRDSEALQGPCQTTKELEDSKNRSENPDAEVLKYFGPHRNIYGTSDGSNGC